MHWSPGLLSERHENDYVTKSLGCSLWYKLHKPTVRTLQWFQRLVELLQHVHFILWSVNDHPTVAHSCTQSPSFPVIWGYLTCGSYMLTSFSGHFYALQYGYHPGLNQHSLKWGQRLLTVLYKYEHGLTFTSLDFACLPWICGLSEFAPTILCFGGLVISWRCISGLICTPLTALQRPNTSGLLLGKSFIFTSGDTAVPSYLPTGKYWSTSSRAPPKRLQNLMKNTDTLHTLRAHSHLAVEA